MIPLSLSIRNFLSYGPDTQEIQFEPYNLICLAGKNGHGKSALLDAMTWVLWGQARKIAGVAKADDALLRLGQHHMVVALIFICNGQKYKARREYNKIYGKPILVLDVGLFDEQQNTFVSLGGKSIRESQAMLEHILRLDFDSFCNSAFLRQGQSNEFSKKSPKERKDILSSILGLDEFEKIRKLATEKNRECTNELNTLTVLQNKCVQELQAMDGVKEDLRVVHEKLCEQSAQEQELKKKMGAVQQERQQLSNAQRQHAEITFCMAQIDQHIAELKQKLRELVSQWRSVHARYVRACDCAHLEAEKKKLLEETQHFQRSISAHVASKEQFDLAQKNVIEMRQSLTAKHAQDVQNEQLEIAKINLEHENLVKKKNELFEKSVALKKVIGETEHRIKTLAQVAMHSHSHEQLYEREMRCLEKRKLFYQRLVAEGNSCKKTLDELTYKLTIAECDDASRCPLCQQGLTPASRQSLFEKLQNETRFVKHRFERISRVLPRLKEVMVVQHGNIKSIECALNESVRSGHLLEDEEKKRNSFQKEVLAIDQAVAEMNMAEQQIVEKSAQLSVRCRCADFSQEIQARVSVEPAYVQAVQQLEGTKKKLDACSYDAHAYECMITKLSDIERTLQDYREILSLQAAQGNRKQEIGQLIVQIKALGRQKNEYEMRLGDYASLHQILTQIEQNERGLEEKQHAMMQEKEKNMHEKGALEQRYAFLLKVQEEHAIQQKNVEDLNERIQELQAVVAATGKDGIQSMLIQEVIPEIELEANALLSKLTDNQAQIFIESVRDLKKGGTKETLDINISDTVGMRPYELFSGGEAFRIDFALRIALSKLLARRAGTSLQTLIIDEGFGSQDEEGLARIMDAIYKIQEDFAKVIIVSHLSGMKDQFPVQFFVEKKPSGSEITVIEQG